jgi:hypothetical protein
VLLSILPTGLYFRKLTKYSRTLAGVVRGVFETVASRTGSAVNRPVTMSGPSVAHAAEKRLNWLSMSRLVTAGQTLAVWFAGCALAAPAVRLEIAAKAVKRRRLFMKAP